MASKGKQPGKRKTRASNREIKWLQTLEGVNRFEAHDERVKELESDIKAFTGEGRKSGSSRDSIRSSISKDSTRSSNGRSSLGSIAGEQSITSLQFIQERNQITLSVKERLRKMQNQKRKKRDSGWDGYGVSRNVVGKFSKYGKYRSVINQYQGFTDYPQQVVKTMENGCEHPKRSVICITCKKSMETLTSDFYTIDAKSCIHSECMNLLI